MAWPFIGRDDEHRAFESLLRSGTPGVVLAGAAGVGKSRLAAELASGLVGDEPLIIAASASSARIPLGAFAPHLESSRGSYDSQAGLLAAASDELRAIDAPLVVDDAHHLDPMSATLLHQSLSRADAHAVVTIRTGEEIPQAVRALWKDDLLGRIDIGPLTEGSTRQLIESVLDGELDRSVADAFWHLSQGNVLYLRHLVEGAIDEGTIRRVDGRWELTGDLPPPRRLVDLLWEEIERAGAAGVLRTVAMMEPFEFDLLVALSSADVVAAAERRNMIRVERSDRRSSVTAAHPLFSEIAVRQATEVEMREVGEEAAEAIEGTGMQRETDLLRVARLRVDARAEIPLDVAMGAARASLRLFDPGMAERILEMGRQDGDSHEARLLHARALSFLDRTEDATSLLDTDMHLTEDEGEIADAATLAIDMLLFSGDPVAGSELADRVLAELTDPVARARVGTEAALVSVVVGDVSAAMAIGESVLDTPDLPDLVRLGVLVTVTFAQPLTGRLHEVDDRIDSGLELTEREDASPLAVHQLTMNRFFARQCQGRTAEAADVGKRHWAEVSGTTGPVAVVGMAVADALFERGEFEEALAIGGTALEEIERFDAFGNRPHIHLWTATLALQIGYEDLALAWEKDAFDESSDVRWVLRRRRIDAWRAVGEGDEDLAKHHYDESVVRADEGGHKLWLLYELGDAIRLGCPRLVIGHLDRLATLMDGETVELFIGHAHALDAGDGPALDQISDRYARLGWTLRAAESAADAARAHLAAGDDVASRRSSMRSALISAEFTALTPPLHEVPEGLSARELEVAGLAASGFSNQELAERLYLSVRTVENHLSRIYRKLDIPDRSQLGELTPAQHH